jgi:hypothetical protein
VTAQVGAADHEGFNNDANNDNKYSGGMYSDANTSGRGVLTIILIALALWELALDTVFSSSLQIGTDM